MKKSISVMIAALLLCGSAMAVTIETNPSTDVYDWHVNNGAFTTGPRLSSSFYDSSEIGMAQTMTTGGTDVEFQNIHLMYQAAVNAPVTLHIFEVTDVSAGTIAVPVLGDRLVSESFIAPASDGSDLLSIELDIAETLTANTGYAIYFDLRLDGLDKGDSFKWRRSTSTSGSFYADGVFYDDDLIKNSGARDAWIALDSIPEPGTLLMMGLGGLVVLRLRKR